MILQTGGSEFGATSTRSSSASRAIRMATDVSTTPTFSLFAPINRTCEARMVSFTRNVIVLIVLSYMIIDETPVRKPAYIEPDNTMILSESSNS